MNPSPLPLAPPRGMRDFYPEDMALRSRIFDAWRAAARCFGFQEYDACVVENLDLLIRKAGEEIVDQIYAFTDKSGRPLALRPEITPTLARMVAARQGSLAFPLRWFTVAQCFRYERMSRGRKREHYQWNLDIIGETSVSAEAEIVAAASHALRLLGLGPTDVTIRFSSRALLNDLLARLHVPPSLHPSVFLILDKQGKIGPEETRQMLTEVGIESGTVGEILGLSRMASIEDAASFLGVRTESCIALHAFQELLDAHGIREGAQFDISVVRGLGYYTGIVFEAFDAGRDFRAIFGGGRYDNLLADIGGQAASGVGLGFGDVVVAEILAKRNAADALPKPVATLAIGYMQAEQQKAAVTLARAFRARGETVEMALREEKARAFFARVGNGAFRKAVYLGPDDIARRTLRIKDLATRAEEEVPWPS